MMHYDKEKFNKQMAENIKESERLSRADRRNPVIKKLQAKIEQLEQREEALNLKLSISEDYGKDAFRLLTDLRAGLQDIFSNRGEDEFIEKICNPLIEKSRLF